MQDLSTVFQTVATALKTGQAGQPCAVRIVANVTSDPSTLERLIADCLTTATDWLRAPLERLTAAGSAEAGHISTLARCGGGQTALVSAATIGAGSPALEVLVFGNHGILSWEAGHSRLTFTPSEESAGGASATGGQPILEDLQEALRTGRQIRTGERLAASNTPRAPAVSATRPRPASPSPQRTPLELPFGILLVAGEHTHQADYIRVFAADPRCRLVAVTDEDHLSPERRRLNEHLAHRYQLPYIASLAEALARPDVQVVCICAEPMRRGRIIVQAAAAGKHVYLDKPLAGTWTDAQAIVAAVEQAGVSNQMYSFVHGQAAGRIRKVLESDRLGELRAVHLDLTFAKGHAGSADLTQPRSETTSPTEFELPDSKRELTNIGVYPLVLLHWLLGRPVRRVAATTGNYFFRDHQQNHMEDFGQLLLELDGGLVATVSAGRTGWRSHPAAGVNRVTLVGERETVVINAHQPHVEVWSDAVPWSAPPRDPEDPMAMWVPATPGPYAAGPKQSWITGGEDPSVVDITHFLDCLEQGRESDVPARMGAAATEVLLAAYRSAARGEVVELPLEADSKKI
jgi:predicted dehydrogenase